MTPFFATFGTKKNGVNICKFYKQKPNFLTAFSADAGR
jgi:hypothetical protein